MDHGRGNNMKEQSSFGEYFDAQYDRLRKMLDNKDAQLHKQWLEEFKKNYEEDKFRSSERTKNS